MKRISRIPIIVIAIAGIAIMGYLTYIHYANVQSFCDISQEVSCDVVTTSIYSELFGIPVSVLGIFYFITVLWLIFYAKAERAYRGILLLTAFALMPSLYLSLTEYVFIKSVCVLCETSKLLMLAILIASFIEARRTARVDFRFIAPALIAGIVAAAVMYFAQTGTVVKKDYTSLVECLNSKEVVYYKSERCANCRRQEKLLGDAYKKLNSVECHPEGKNPQPELCLKKGVTKTPTFLIEPDGQETKRVVGLQRVEELAKFAGCPVGN